VGEREIGMNSSLTLASDKLFSLSPRRRGERGGVRGEYLKKSKCILVNLKVLNSPKGKLFSEPKV